MTAAYVRGAALVSALADDLDSATRALQGAAQDPPGRIVAGGTWPYHPIARTGDWMPRAASIARTAASDLRARAALDDAAWSSLACVVGSSSYSAGSGDNDHWRALDTPLEFCRRLAQWFEVRGPLMAVSTACTSGLGAVDVAASLIGNGTFRHVLVLGVELVNKLTVAGFAGLELLSPSRARPCDRARDGMVLGETLSALLLSAEPAVWRLRALASGIDATSLTGPSPDGASIVRIMSEAMAKSHWSTNAVDLIKLQASGSRSSDAAEMRALHDLFAPLPRLISFKGALGHTLGASGPAELALLLRSIDRGTIPGTWGFSAAADEYALMPAPGDATDVRRILFNLSGFGGAVMTLALERDA